MGVRLYAFSSSLLMLSCVSGYAQGQSADTKAILDALQGINSRLDAMDQRIDKVENSGSSPAPAASSSAAQTTAPSAASASPDQADASAPPPGMIAQPGWLISSILVTNNEVGTEPFFVFPLPNMPLKMSEALDRSGMNQLFAYKGEAKLNIYQNGRYQFNAIVESEGSSCFGNILVNGDEVVNLGNRRNQLQFNGKGFRQGGIDLSIGNYDAEFNIACAVGYNFDRKRLNNTRFDVQVRGPNEMRPRSFEGNEVFYFVPRDAAQVGTEPLPSVGDKRQLKSSLNVRRTASTNAPVAAQPSAGDTLEVVGLASDREWAEVAMNGRKLGFVKLTALNANSQ